MVLQNTPKKYFSALTKSDAGAFQYNVCLDEMS